MCIFAGENGRDGRDRGRFRVKIDRYETDEGYTGASDREKEDAGVRIDRGDLPSSDTGGSGLRLRLSAPRRVERRRHGGD